MSVDYVSKGALISLDHKYRYLLWREWRGTHDPQNWEWMGDVDGRGEPLGEPRACVFVMLNPSTADGDVDDPTIRRCVGFARRWKYEKLVVVNLFAYRTTSPKVLLAQSLDEAVGPQNREMIQNAIESSGRIVCAWGSHGKHLGQDETVLGWIGQREVHCLGLTAGLQPRHPLYIPEDREPVLYKV